MKQMIRSILFKNGFTLGGLSVEIETYIQGRFCQSDILNISDYDLIPILQDNNIDQNYITEVWKIETDNYIFIKSQYDGYFIDVKVDG